MTQRLQGVGVLGVLVSQSAILKCSASFTEFATDTFCYIIFYDIFLNFENFWWSFSAFSKKVFFSQFFFFAGCQLQATRPQAGLSTSLQVQMSM